MGQRIAEEKEMLSKLEEEENKELKKVEKKIREIEDSISALDWELERAEIEKMKLKTKKVIKRISQIVNEDLENDVSTNLKKETVKVFMINKAMWNKYLKLESG